ncbi:MAG: hypothetical protein DWQ05_13215 [Calditrichaeota bacterium]|nr:MAG: hypothetical protein DWQ05_13215 [Calditrichota bacterium]
MNEIQPQSGIFAEERTLSIADYLRIVRRRWWLIVLCFIMISAGTAFYTLNQDPVFQAASTIMVQEDGGMQSVLFDQNALFGKQDEINDQVYLLKSRSIAEHVIQEVMRSDYSKTLPIIKNGVELALEAHHENYEGQPVDTVRIMQQARAYAVGKLRAGLTADPVIDTNYFIEIRVKGSSPFEAAYLTNLVATIYQNQDQILSQGEIREVVDFLEEQLSKKELDLKSSEEELKSFQEKENIADLSGDTQELINQLAEFETLYNSALTDLKAYEKRLEYLNQQLGIQKKNLQNNIAQISNPLILKLRDELAEIERKASSFLSQDVSEDNPNLKKLRSRQETIKERLITETKKLVLGGLTPNDPMAHAQQLVSQVIEAETEIRTLKARSVALKGIVDTYSKKLEKLPAKTLRLARLARTKSVDEKLYYMMKEKYEESRISMAGQIGKVRIIDRAVEPGSPISPKKRQNLMLGMLFGLGLGFAIAISLEYLDKTVRTVEDIERLNLPFVGTIPHIDVESSGGLSSLLPNGNGKNADFQARMIALNRPKSPISEAYRIIRTNLQYSQADGNLKTILITSPGPGEGKSTTTINLGITLANMGLKTLIIDADLRRPVVHNFFKFDKKPGLTNLLATESAADDVIKTLDIDNLHILTSGVMPPNPSELLGSVRMRNLLESLKSQFDIILLDSPPIIAVTDALIVASEVDGVLLINKSGKSQIEGVKRADQLLKTARARFLGVVLNDVRAENMYGSYYYYYSNQYYYGESSTQGNNGKYQKRHKKRKVS